MFFIDFILRRCGFGRRKGCDERRIIRPGYPSIEYCDNEVTSSKYTILTFLPMNLFEQFYRPINLYFLLVTALQFVPSASPVSPFTTLVPLSIAFFITAIKEGIDDWRRHRLDNTCNSRIYNIINIDTLKVEEIKCSDIQVGDMLLLLPMEIVPCDVVLLLSSGENGEVLISTEALDGETVCKTRYAVLSDIYSQRPTPSTTTVDSIQDEENNIRAAAEFIKDTSCIIDSEGPKPFLNSYSGAAKVKVPNSFTEEEEEEEEQEEEILIGISAENVALNSSVIKNTRFAIGVAVLTGNETRVAMTRATPPTKWSMIDKYYNRMALVVFALQFILVAIYVSVSDTLLQRNQINLWYLGIYDDKIALTEYVLVLPLRFFLLVSPMVPLSFKVMLDASKAYISQLIKWDKEISDEFGNTEVHNSSLMEDLGQIEYVLTDKTGTLTCNTMTLKSIVAANGSIFSLSSTNQKYKMKWNIYSDNNNNDNSVRYLMRVLLYCNTIESTARITTNITTTSSVSSRAPINSSSTWISPSPDEVALIEGACRLGVKLLERTKKRAYVSFADIVESVTILQILHFTPERRRMSVLIQIDGETKYLLLTKGSDDSVLPRCINTSYERSIVLNTLNNLNSEGLRTLIFAYKYIEEIEALKWMAEMRKQSAISSTDARALGIVQTYEYIEKDLIYCGITGVEDQLQENVCHTITQMRLAGMRVWMLTGDKSEAAKQTAISSGLVGSKEKIVALTPADMDTMSVREHLDYVEKHVNYALQRRQFIESEKGHNIISSWYVRSGLRDIIGEFLNSSSVSSLIFQSMRKNSNNTNYSNHYTLYEDYSISSEKEPMIYGATRKENEGYVISLSGKTIELMKDSNNKELFHNFKRVLLHASTVICSRMTPDQKSFIVRLVKKSGHVTLAVGDGGNDVSMIQSAHVGIGIKGKEGTQAAAASDVVISKFYFLSKLLLFHGHTAYQRSSIIVQHSFWKTVALAWVQLLFNIYSDFSGVTFWDSFSLMMYNSLFTAPVTFLCTMNMPLSPSALINIPQLYALCQSGRYLNIMTFYGYTLRGFLHGTILFFLSYGVIKETNGGLLRLGYTMDRSCDFYIACCSLVTLHSAIIILETHSITFLHWLALLWSVMALFILFTFHGIIFKNYSFLELLCNGSFYLQWILGVAVPFLSLAIYSTIKFFFFPDLLQLQRYILYALSKNTTLYQFYSNIFENSNSQFLKSLSPVYLCHSEGRRSRISSIIGISSSLDMNSINNEERIAINPPIRTLPPVISDISSVSSNLSEPFLKNH